MCILPEYAVGEFVHLSLPGQSRAGLEQELDGLSGMFSGAMRSLPVGITRTSDVAGDVENVFRREHETR